jgi:hypothetical protein
VTAVARANEHPSALAALVETYRDFVLSFLDPRPEAPDQGLALAIVAVG